MIWEYGITTVPERLRTTLPVTLKSLAAAGFDRPRLFVDGYTEEYERVGDLPEIAAARAPSVGAFGNWFLGIWELYIRNPRANRYAMFEDDVLAVAWLREYLERCGFPADGYLNLYTCNAHANWMPVQSGWHRVPRGESGCQGKGALGLVFDNSGLRSMLSQMDWVGHPCRENGNRNQDGAVWRAMVGARVYEYVHNPSLLQHVGRDSVLYPNDQFTQAASFPGESFNPLELLS